MSVALIPFGHSRLKSVRGPSSASPDASVVKDVLRRVMDVTRNRKPARAEVGHCSYLEQRDD